MPDSLYPDEPFMDMDGHVHGVSCQTCWDDGWIEELNPVGDWVKVACSEHCAAGVFWANEQENLLAESLGE